MNNFKKNLFAGIMSIIPIYITFWIIKNLFIFFSNPGQSLLNVIIENDLLNDYILFTSSYYYLKHIVGFLLTILFLYTLGLIVKNVLGNKIYIFFENILSNIPVINKIYNTIKNITDTVSSSNKQSFTKVVIIEYPKENLWTLAMVTSETKDHQNNDYYTLFVPTTPNPTSGYMIIVNKKDVKETDISVDEGLSIIISGGMAGPKTYNIN